MGFRRGVGVGVGGKEERRRWQDDELSHVEGIKKRQERTKKEKPPSLPKKKGFCSSLSLSLPLVTVLPLNGAMN